MPAPWTVTTTAVAIFSFVADDGGLPSLPLLLLISATRVFVVPYPPTPGSHLLALLKSPIVRRSRRSIGKDLSVYSAPCIVQVRRLSILNNKQPTKKHELKSQQQQGQRHRIQSLLQRAPWVSLSLFLSFYLFLCLGLCVGFVLFRDSTQL